MCSFLTKVLCAHGGRMFLQDLRGHVELSEARLRDVLRQAGPDRFLLQEVEVREGPWDAEAEVAAGAGGGGGPLAWRVVAVSSARVCARYQRGECQACDQLHLCHRHMLGKCPNRGSQILNPLHEDGDFPSILILNTFSELFMSVFCFSVLKMLFIIFISSVSLLRFSISSLRHSSFLFALSMSVIVAFFHGCFKIFVREFQHLCPLGVGLRSSCFLG